MATTSLGGWSWASLGFSWPRRGGGSSSRDNFEREQIYVGRSKSGISITAETLFQTSALICAARVVSQGVAQVPCKLFLEEDSGGRSVRKPAREHPVYRLLADQPNDFMTSFSFRETMVLHAMLGKGGFAYIDRRANGSVRELLPIVPDHINVAWNDDKRVLEYHWHDGSPEGRILTPQQVLHLHGPSWTGYSGLEALELAREAIGLGAALEKSQGDLFGKGGRPSGVLTAEGNLSPAGRESLREQWNERFGPGGEGGVATLDGGLKFQAMQTTPVDGQLIENRKFQIEEIARFTMVFPQMLMSSDKTATFASAEQFFLAHVIHTLDPWMDRFEQEIKRSVLGYDGDNADLYPRFIREGLLRGAAKDRSEFYGKALGSGGSPAFMTQNEIRERENLNPIDDPAYDALPVPVNAQTAAPGAGGGDEDDES